LAPGITFVVAFVLPDFEKISSISGLFASTGTCRSNSPKSASTGHFTFASAGAGS
jgi:hypothetical protein